VRTKIVIDNKIIEIVNFFLTI